MEIVHGEHMRELYAEYLRNTYPQFFGRGGIDKDESGKFHFACGDGWYPLILKLCEELTALPGAPKITVTQVKEKFGTLRFYVETKSEEAQRRIIRTEYASAHVCESCGAEGTLFGDGGYLVTSCEPCHKRQIVELGLNNPRPRKTPA